MTTRMMLENPPLLNQQCTHKCVGNHCPLVGGVYCTDVFLLLPQIVNFKSDCEFFHNLIYRKVPKYRKVVARSGVRGRADVRACARAWPCLRDSM